MYTFSARSEQSELLDVAHFVPKHSIVLRLFLGVQQYSSSHRCSSLLSTPPLTLSPCPPQCLLTLGSRTHTHTDTTQSRAHKPALLTAHHRPKWDGGKERDRERIKERRKEGFTEGCACPSALVTSFCFDPLISVKLHCCCTLQVSNVSC